MITPQEMAEKAIKKYGEKWQSAMARDVQKITGCELKRAINVIHRLKSGKNNVTTLAEVAIRLLTK